MVQLDPEAGAPEYLEHNGNGDYVVYDAEGRVADYYTSGSVEDLIWQNLNR